MTDQAALLAVAVLAAVLGMLYLAWAETKLSALKGIGWLACSIALVLLRQALK